MMISDKIKFLLIMLLSFFFTLFLFNSNLIQADTEIQGKDKPVISNSTGRMAPTASAGTDFSTYPALIKLNGGGSMNSSGTGSGLTFAWTQLSGPKTVDIFNSLTSSPYFILTDKGDYEFQLTVQEGTESDTDTILITVDNAAPTAYIGNNITINSGTVIQLDGSLSSDPNNDTLSYSWTPIEYYSNSLIADPFFSGYAKNGIYKISLTVSDGSTTSESISSYIIVNGEDNLVPYSNAGFTQIGYVDQSIQLDGTRSKDIDGSIEQYTWKFISGPEVISLSTSDKPRFTPTLPGIYTFSLTVLDDDGISSLPSFVDSIVLTPGGNSPPWVDAKISTEETIISNKVELTGSASDDPDGDELSYTWTQTSGPTVVLDSSGSADTFFYPIIPGNYSFKLTISDSEFSIESQEVSVKANPLGVTNYVTSAPKISSTSDPDNDGRVSIASTDSVFLDGIDSTGEGTLKYNWYQIEGFTSRLYLTQSSEMFFKPSRSGVYKFRLVVTDENNVMDYNDIYVVVDNYDSTANPGGNYIPVADAGLDKVAFTGIAVTLNGENSYDSADDGDGVEDLNSNLIFYWKQTAGPLVTLANYDTAYPSFTPTIPAVYIFELYISDGYNYGIPDEIRVTVNESTLSSNNNNSNSSDNNNSITTDPNIPVEISTPSIGSYSGKGFCFISKIFR